MSGWPTENLGQVCEINPRLPPSAIADDGCPVSFVPMAGVDEKSGRIVGDATRPYGQVRKGYTSFVEDDILFAKITPCMENGKAALARGLVGGVGCGSTEFHVLRPGPRILPEWVFAFVRQESFRSAAKASFTGTAGQQRVPASFFQTVPIPVPPLPEQRRIVAILDAADELRRLRAEADRRAASLIPSLFHSMFGDPSTRLAHWPDFELKEVALTEDGIKCGPFGSQLHRSDFQAAGIPLWGIKHVNGHFAVPTADHLSAAKAIELEAYSLVADDIVMTRKGTIGNCALYPRGLPPGIMHSDLLRIRVNPSRCAPSFLSCQLQLSHGVQGQIEAMSIGAVMGGINVSKLKHLKILLPPIELQRRFTARVAEIRSMQESQDQSRRRLDDLFNSLLHRAFKGDL